MCDDGKKSEVDYRWAVLFRWNINNPKPFEIFPKSIFVDEEEVPETWFTHGLGYQKRQKRFEVQVLDKDDSSMFSRIETGNCC